MLSEVKDARRSADIASVPSRRIPRAGGAIGSADERRRRCVSAVPCTHADSCPLLLLLFVGSGCAALIYEIVWFQLLAAGHRIVGRLAGRAARHVHGRDVPGQPAAAAPDLAAASSAARLRVRSSSASASSACSCSSACRSSAASTPRGRAPASAGCPCRGVIAAGLPAAADAPDGRDAAGHRALGRDDAEGVSWLGFFYGGNIAGAVVGSLLAGFYLLRVYDMRVATYVAVALNVVVAALALADRRRRRRMRRSAAASVGTDACAAPGAWAVYVAIALSGMTALGAEVVWTRLLSLLFGATVYTFSLILAVFLVGLGIGSSVGAAIGAQRRASARRARRLPAAAVRGDRVDGVHADATRCRTGRSIRRSPIDPVVHASARSRALPVGRAAGAILWGASFPLALASVAAPGQDPARLVGGVYAANTVGAIVGALGASLVLVAWIGSQHAAAGADRRRRCVAGAARAGLGRARPADA